MDYIVSIILFALEASVAVLFCNTWLEKKSFKCHWLLAFVTHTLACFSLVYIFLVGGVTPLKMLVLGTFFIAWSYLFWCGDFWPRFMLALTFLSLTNVTDYAFSGLVWLVAGVQYDALLASHFYFTLTSLTSKLSLFGLAYAICRASTTSSQVRRNWKDWAILSLAPLGLLILTLYITDYLQQHGALGEQLLMVVLLMATTTILYFIRTADADNATQVADNATQVTDLLMEHQQLLVQQNEEQRMILHDTTNFSLSLYDLLQQGKQQRALEMLEQELGRRGPVPLRIRTEHDVVDAILNSQYDQAQAQDIKFIAEMCSLKHLAMQALDIAMVLYNLLDNARHACHTCNGERCIMVQAVPSGTDCVRLTVRNTYDPTLSKASVRSNTVTVAEHGYGRQIVQQVLQKYDCTVFTEQKNGWYKVLIRLPCPQPPDVVD